jgi:tetratricopeptide (TPR) repeat protein
VIAAIKFVFTRTVILVLGIALLSLWLVDFDRMKLKALNRVVPASITELAQYVLDPKPEKKDVLVKYLPYFKTMSVTVKKSSTAFSMLGYTYSMLGDQNKAEKSYLKAISIHPSFFWFYYSLGVIYFNEGRYDKAVDTLQKAAACRMEDALIFINVSKFYKDMNEELSELGYDPQDGLMDGYRRTHELLAKSYYRLQKYKEAFIILENSARLGLHPQSTLYYYSGLAALGMKDYERAAALFQQATKIDPQDRHAYYYLGMCLEKMGYMREADQVGWKNLPPGKAFDSFGKEHYEVQIF